MLFSFTDPMLSVLPYAFVVFGLIIGSFLNVLILRYNTGKGFGGRSECFSCGRQLTGRDLWPVLSFLLHKGRCRTCKSKISRQYVLVELATAIFFYLVYVHNAANSASWSIFLIKSAVDCAIMSLLVFMAGYDIRHKIIPDLGVFIFGGLALISSCITLHANGLLSVWPLSHPASSATWWLLAAGPLLALPFYLIWLLSGGRWMGLGDAKLVLGFGWMLGLSMGYTAAIFGFWAGAAYAVCIMLLRPDIKLRNKLLIVLLAILALGTELKYGIFSISPMAVLVMAMVLLVPIILSQTPFLKKLTRWGHLPALEMKSEVPFAPFLIIGLLIVYVLGYNIFVFSI